MRRRPSPAPLLASAAVVLLVLAIAAPPVLAKGEYEVTFTTPIPGDAEPGSTIDVAFVAIQPLSDGGSVPAEGIPMVIRLVPVDGSRAARVPAVADRAVAGRYTARVVVPTSGVAAVEVAIRGESCDASGCVISDLPLTVLAGAIAPTAVPGVVAPTGVAASPAVVPPPVVAASPAVVADPREPTADADPMGGVSIGLAVGVVLLLGVAALRHHRRGTAPHPV